jgi:hypothetical protein
LAAEASPANVDAMASLFKRPITIHGHPVPARRWTARGVWYALVFLGLPVTMVLLILDGIGWLVATQLLGMACYGIGCFF